MKGLLLLLLLLLPAALGESVDWDAKAEEVRQAVRSSFSAYLQYASSRPTR